MAKNNQSYDRKPYVVNLEDVTGKNENYRSTIWTGEKMQVIAMTLGPEEEAGRKCTVKPINLFLSEKEWDSVEWAPIEMSSTLKEL